MSKMTDILSEQILLSGIARNSKIFFDINDKISEADFSQNSHCVIFKLLQNIIIDKQPSRVDEFLCLTTAKSISLNLSKMDKEALEMVLARDVSEQATIEAAKQVKKLSVKRFLQNVLSQESDDIEKSDGKISEIVGGLEGRLYTALSSLGQTESDCVNLADYAFDYAKGLVGSKPIGMSLGFPKWEESIGLIRNGSVHGIFSRMKQGKSQLALQLVVRAAIQRGIPTLVLDTELGKDIQSIRLCAQIAGIPYKYIESGTWVRSSQYVEAFNEAEKLARGKPIVYASIAGETIDVAVNHIRKFALKYNTNVEKTPKVLVVYDYIKLPDIAQLGAAKEYQILGAITSRLHDEALNLSLPIMVVGQQNREAIETDSVNTIADSDKIARDIESVSLIRRKTQTELNYDSAENGTHILKVLASRNGPGHVGDDYINLAFDMSCGKIEEKQDFYMNKLEFLREKTDDVSTEKV